MVIGLLPIRRIVAINRRISSVSAPRKRQHHIAPHQHAQVAVYGLSWMKVERGVPVELSVAATFRAMIPLLPMPVTTTRPPQECRRSTAAQNPAPWARRCGRQFAQRFRFNAHYIGTCGFHSRTIVADPGIAAD
jgi:hypothetical protein